MSDKYLILYSDGKDNLPKIYYNSHEKGSEGKQECIDLVNIATDYAVIIIAITQMNGINYVPTHEYIKNYFNKIINILETKNYKLVETCPMGLYFINHSFGDTMYMDRSTNSFYGTFKKINIQTLP